MTISKQELQINEEIRDKEVLVIDADGKKLGVLSAAEAQKIAFEKDLDLVKPQPMSQHRPTFQQQLSSSYIQNLS